MQFKKFSLSLFAVAVVSMTGTAFAVVGNFTETFNTNASGWLNGASGAPTYNSTGGVDDSGYISYSFTGSTAASGSFGAPPLQILFRGNNSANASGDAFVGNWLTADIESFSVSFIHNYSTDLTLYARFDAGAGAAASLAPDALYTIAPNTWTTITFSIEDGNPPFLSYGAGTFNTVFTNIQNLQLGLYLPASTQINDLVVGIDNVTTTVPEPTSALLVGLGLGLAAITRRRLANR